MRCVFPGIHLALEAFRKIRRKKKPKRYLLHLYSVNNLEATVEKDSELVQKTLQGDKDAYGKLVTKYQGAVYGLCFHLVGNFADAQDLAQEAFVQAYLSLHQLREPGKFASWLYSVTANICKMWLRKRKVEISSLDEVARKAEFSSEFPSPHEMVEKEEQRLAVQRAIASLSEKNRLAVVLHYIDGLSHQEISDFLSVPISAIKSRLHRARLQLKEELIAMVEETFEGQKLPEDFSEKVMTVLNMHMSGQISDAEAIQMLGGEYDIFDASENRDGVFDPNEDSACERLEKYLFEGENKALEGAQYPSVKYLVSSIRRGSTYHDDVIGLRDVISLVENAEYFIKNNTIAGFEYGTSILSKEDDGIHILGWRNQRSQNDRRIEGLPPTSLIFQDSVFHYNANLTIPLPPVKVGSSLNKSVWNWAQIIIESDSDVITTPAGRFENCLRLRTLEHKSDTPLARLTGMPDAPITKIGWYALGVGMVKFRVIQDEEIKEFQLVEYETPTTKTDTYFPVNIGVKWVYEWQSKWFLCREISRPVDIVERWPNGEEHMHLHFGVLYALRT